MQSPKDPTSSPSKKKVAPLIESRHEWLQEHEKIHKRNSIRDEDIPRSLRLDAAASTGTPRNSMVASSGSHGSNDVTLSQVGVQELASRFASAAPFLQEEGVPINDDLEQQQQQQPPWMNSTMSMDVSMESLDRVDREYWGNARRHSFHPALQRLGSEATMTVDNTTTDGDGVEQRRPLARIQVADSVFLGFARCGMTHESQVVEFVSQLRLEHANAAHIPYAYWIPEEKSNDNDNNHKNGFDEDGEPPNSTGPYLLDQLQDFWEHSGDGVWLFPEEAGGVCDPTSGTCVAIVRYFGQELLGVTCGRLSQCYQRIAQLTLHRLFRGTHIPLQLDFTNANTNLPGTPTGNYYGLAGGDTELHLNIVPGDNKDTLMTSLLEELNFDGFQGAKGEVLPRLQNLQADFYQYNPTTQLPTKSDTGTIIPCYRYPGNYRGDQWETFAWSTTSLKIKQQVETALPHFYGGQKMNHCVTNFYRHGDDYIAHHSDKDLDLDQAAAIVSVSIGAERVLELRRRAEPRDWTRLLLPHGSMLLLGPVTNRYFTHSILPAQQRDDIVALKTCSDAAAAASHNLPQQQQQQLDQNARISLTLRRVTTFMDTKTQRLFGQGVEIPTLQELRRAQRWDSLYFLLGFSAVVQTALRHEHYLTDKLLALSWKQSTTTTTTSRSRLESVAQDSVVVLGSAAVAWLSYARLRKAYLKRKEERAARQFFTSKSTSGTKY